MSQSEEEKEESKSYEHQIRNYRSKYTSIDQMNNPDIGNCFRRRKQDLDEEDDDYRQQLVDEEDDDASQDWELSEEYVGASQYQDLDKKDVDDRQDLDRHEEDKDDRLYQDREEEYAGARLDQVIIETSSRHSCHEAPPLDPRVQVSFS